MTQNVWNKKETWSVRFDTFVVSVEHWSVDHPMIDYHQGRQRWNVHCHVFANHPLFSFIEGDSIFQDFLQNAPLHCGNTLLRRNGLDSVTFGSDYNHLHDDRFTHYSTMEEAIRVFRDADALVEWMSDWKPDNDYE